MAESYLQQYATTAYVETTIPRPIHCRLDECVTILMPVYNPISSGLKNHFTPFAIKPMRIGSYCSSTTATQMIFASKLRAMIESDSLLRERTRILCMKQNERRCLRP